MSFGVFEFIGKKNNLKGDIKCLGWFKCELLLCNIFGFVRRRNVVIIFICKLSGKLFLKFVER